MIANVQYEIQIVDTHESLETLVNAGVAAGTSQFNRTLVIKAVDRVPLHSEKTYASPILVSFVMFPNQTLIFHLI